MPNVVATRRGQYGGKMREPGDEFFVTLDQHLSDKWMAVDGTPKHASFIAAHAREPAAKRDAITGERLASGGIAEEMAILQGELAVARASLAELRAEMALMQERAPDREPVGAPNPDTPPDSDVQENSKPQRIRRRVVAGEA